MNQEEQSSREVEGMGWDYDRGGNRFAKLVETNNLEQISMLDHILRLFSIESKWFPSNLAFIPDL